MHDYNYYQLKLLGKSLEEKCYLMCFSMRCLKWNDCHVKWVFFFFLIIQHPYSSRLLHSWVSKKIGTSMYELTSAFQIEISNLWSVSLPPVLMSHLLIRLALLIIHFSRFFNCVSVLGPFLCYTLVHRGYTEVFAE